MEKGRKCVFIERDNRNLVVISSQMKPEEMGSGSMSFWMLYSGENGTEQKKE